MFKSLTILFLFLTVSATTIAQNLKCLTDAIYHEARGEPTHCQEKVAMVIFKRTYHKSFPNNICSVVYQKRQFSWVGKGYSVREQSAYSRAKQVADRMYANYQLGNYVKSGSPAVYFTTGIRFKNTRVVERCGSHIFMASK